MVETQAGPAVPDILRRLERAINERDIEALVDCFQPDVLVEYPAHPSRNFRGRDQIWRNWAPILARLADFKATVLRAAVDEGSAWAEWLWQGTQADGSPGDMAGIAIHILEDDKIARVRFYLEPVDQ